MNSLTKVLFRRLVRLGIKRGLVEGSRSWFFVGAFAWVIRRLLRQKSPEVRREVLEPGQTMVISNVAGTTRHRRRRSKEQRNE